MDQGQKESQSSERVVSLQRKSDKRGWLVEIFSQELSQGLVYGFQSNPGAVRGGHYHTRKSEWFCVLKGRVQVVLKDRATGTRMEHILDGNIGSCKVFVPPGVTHTVTTLGTEESMVIAYVDEAFNSLDPDTFPDS